MCSIFQSLLDDKTQWTTRYGCIAGLAELGSDVSIITCSSFWFFDTVLKKKTSCFVPLGN